MPRNPALWLDLGFGWDPLLKVFQLTNMELSVNKSTVAGFHLIPFVPNLDFVTQRMVKIGIVMVWTWNVASGNKVVLPLLSITSSSQEDPNNRTNSVVSLNYRQLRPSLSASALFVSFHWQSL